MKGLFSYPLLASLLVIGLALNFLVVSQANAGWNHLYTGDKWAGTTIYYDIAGGFTSAQENMIRDNTDSWDRQCTADWNQNWYSGNDWWVENIDSLGLTVTSASGDEIVKATTRIDTDSEISDDYIPSYNEYDFNAIASHEWGHWIRLRDDKSHSSALMYYSLGKGKQDSNPNSEDLEACNYTY